MTEADFRALALSLPGVVEASHMGHADFRVGGKIFATLPGEGRGMVKLRPAQQAEALAAKPTVFQAANGAWGRQGCTYVRLAGVTPKALRPWLVAAWRGTAPKRLSENFDG